MMVMMKMMMVVELMMMVVDTPHYHPLHYVYFVRYDVTVSFLAQVLDTVTYFVSHVFDSGYSDIFCSGYSDIFWGKSRI